MANTYFVSNSGSNSNPGTISLPFLTIQRAANSALAGDTVNVRGGTYAGFTVVSSGSAGNLITFQNYNGESVTVDASLGTVPSAVFSSACIALRNKAYVQISGFRITGSAAFVEIEVFACDHINILSNDISFAMSTGVGIYEGSTNIYVYDNTIHDNSQSNNPRGQPGDWGAGLISAYGNSSITFYKNYIYFNHGEGCTMGAHTHDSLIDGNIITDNWSMNLYLESSQNLTVRNNIIYTTDAGRFDSGCIASCGHANPVGIGLTSGDNSGGFSGANVWLTNIYIYNNIISNNDWCIQRFSTGSSTPDSNWFIANNLFFLNGYPGIKVGNGASSLTNLQIQNNIFTGTLGSSFADWAWINVNINPVSSTINHNTYAGSVSRWIWNGTTYTTLSSWSSASGDSSSSTATANLITPTFSFPKVWGSGATNPTTILSLATDNLRLQSPSSAIATGVTLATVPTDILGVSRPQGAAYCKGTYEFATASSISVSPVTSGWNIPSVILDINLGVNPVTSSWTIPEVVPVGGSPQTINPDVVTSAWTIPDVNLESPLSVDVTTSSWTIPDVTIAVGPPLPVDLPEGTLIFTDGVSGNQFLAFSPDGDNIPLSLPVGTDTVTGVGITMIPGVGYAAVSGPIVSVFDTEFNLLGTQNLTFNVLGVVSNYNDAYYAFDYFSTFIYKLSSVDASVLDTWDLSALNVTANLFGVTPDDLIAYVEGIEPSISTYTFIGGALAPLVNPGPEQTGPGEAGYFRVRQDGKFYVVHLASGSFPTAVFVVQYYDTDGSLLDTYTPASDTHNFIEWVALGKDDTTFWWKRWKGSGATLARVEEIRVSDGSVLHSFDILFADYPAYDFFGAAFVVTPQAAGGADVTGTFIISISRPDISFTGSVPRFGNGIYIMRPGKTNDSVYTNVAEHPPEIDSVKIPNPFADMYLAGDE